MTVYKNFIKLACRNKSTVLIYAVIYLFITVLVGAGLTKDTGEYYDIRSSIGYMDNSKTDISEGLIKSLGSKNYLNEVDFTIYEIKEELYLEKYDSIIIIPSDFKERALAKEENIIDIYKDPKNIYSVTVENSISKFLTYVNAMKVNDEYDLGRIQKAMEKEAAVKNIGDANLNNRVLNYFATYFGMMSYAILGIFISIFGKLILQFNEKKISWRTYVSSKTIFSYNKSIFLAELTLALAVLTIFIVFLVFYKGEFISEVPMMKYIVNVLAFSFSIMGLTFLISNLVNTVWAVNAISNLLSLGLSFISGVFVPQYLLNSGTLRIAKFFPVYYYIQGAYSIDKLKVSDIKFEIGIQILFGIVYFLLGIYFSRNKRVEIE